MADREMYKFIDKNFETLKKSISEIFKIINKQNREER